MRLNRPKAPGALRRQRHEATSHFPNSLVAIRVVKARPTADNRELSTVFLSPTNGCDVLSNGLRIKSLDVAGSQAETSQRPTLVGYIPQSEL